MINDIPREIGKESNVDDLNLFFIESNCDSCGLCIRKLRENILS